MALFEEVNIGEIWEQATPGGKVREVLIVRKFRDYCAVMYVSESGMNTENSLTIHDGRRQMVSDAGKLGYAYYNSLSEFMHRLTVEEKERVERKLESAFFPRKEKSTVTSADDGKAISLPPVKAADMMRQLAHKPEPDSVWKFKYDTLKELYDGLLERMMKR